MEKWQEKSVAIAQTGTASGAFRLIPGYPFVGAYVPAMDDGDIGLEASLDGGDNYVPVTDSLDGADVVICSSGSDPAYGEFSDHVRSFPRNANTLFRFTCAAQNSAAVTVRIMFTADK